MMKDFYMHYSLLNCSTIKCMRIMYTFQASICYSANNIALQKHFLEGNVYTLSFITGLSFCPFLKGKGANVLHVCSN